MISHSVNSGAADVFETRASQLSYINVHEHCYNLSLVIELHRTCAFPYILCMFFAAINTTYVADFSYWLYIALEEKKSCDQ